jgi:TolB-like protein
MLGVAVALALSTAGGDVKLAAHPLTVTGMDPTMAQGLTDHLAQSFRRVRVITPHDIAAVLGLERQKELLGCAENAANCMAELGNALGVSGVIVGEVLKVGQHVQVNLRVLDAASGRVVASHAEELDSAEDVLQALKRSADDLEQQLLHMPTATSHLAAIPFAIGVAAGVAGAVLFGLALDLHARLTSGQPGSFTEDPAQAVARGQTFQTAGIVLVSAAAVGLIVAGILWLVSGSSEGGR